MNDVSNKLWLLPKQQAVLDLRQRAWAAGYRPVAVYEPEAGGSSPGKRPYGDDWTGRARQTPPDTATSAPKNHILNTGFLCDRLRALDIDVDHPEIVEAIIALAIRILGNAPMRFRTNSPRRLLLYRASEGEPPKRFVIGSKGKVEVLGRGQQFVAFGMHESGVEHHWAPLNFLDFHADTLIAVTEAQVDQFLQEVAILIEAVPAKPAKKQKASEREHAYAAAALSNSFVELVAMGEGSGRNNALNGTAYRMGRMIGAGWIDRTTVETALMDASRQNGYEAKRGMKAVNATIKSGLESGIKQPHEPLTEVPILEGVLALSKQGQERFGPFSQGAEPQSSNATRSTFLGDTAIVRRVSDVKSEPIEWLWKTRIAYGKVTMIAGDPGLGKSQFAAYIIARITTGTAWPNSDGRPAIGNTVMLSCEDDVGDTIRPRLEAAGADIARVKVMEAIRTQNGGVRGLSLITDIKQLEIFLDNNPVVRLIVIDPITAYLDKADTHKTADVRAALMPLQMLAAKRKVAVVVISHHNKSGGNGKAVNAVTGSGAFVALARASFTVIKKKGEEDVCLFLETKNNLAKAKGLSYRVKLKILPDGIEAPYIVFDEGTVDISADEAIGEGSPQRDHSQFDAAKLFLTEELRYGPVAVTTLFDRATEQRISEKTMRRAQKELGIKPKKNAQFQGGWFWELPFVAGDWATIKSNLDIAKMAKTAKDDQAIEGASLGSVGHLWTIDGGRS
jgi:putative DNA primase/helicase